MGGVGWGRRCEVGWCGRCGVVWSGVGGVGWSMGWDRLTNFSVCFFTSSCECASSF